MKELIWRLFYPVVYNLAYTYFRFLPKTHRLNQWINARQSGTLNFGVDLNKKTIAFNCPSLGEYEMVKQLISLLKKEYNIHVTIFSTSGYHYLIANHNNINSLRYSPLENQSNLHRHFSSINVSLVLIISNNFWPNYLKYLNSKNIPFLLLGTTIQSPKSLIERIYDSFIMKQLMGARMIYTHSLECYDYLRKSLPNKLALTSNLRLASILADKRNIIIDPQIIDFCSSRNTIIFGSTHPKDDEIILENHEYLIKKYQVIIVPHDISGEYINQLNISLAGSQLYSNFTQDNNCNTLIINEKGMLKHLYSLASLVYIGGGFDRGIHNVLEPIVYRKPVIFGPNYDKFIEAKVLIENGMGISITDSQGLKSAISELSQTAISEERLIDIFKYHQIDKDLAQIQMTIDKSID